MNFVDHLFRPVDEGCGCEKCGVSMGTGLGVPYSDANKLWKIPINQYQASDADFVGDGDDPATSDANVPATLAARTAGGDPHPFTLRNGINKRALAGLYTPKDK